MYTEVLFEEIPGHAGNLGVITLNRPSALNAINHDMITAISETLHKWKDANDIKAVIIRAVPGRAFCAGGDLRLTYERAKHHENTMTEFFREEYQLNRLIYHYPKPYIAILDGITMGGGVGLSIHGSHRVVTENVVFAMPETGIGFFPDVGGSHFLPRLPGKIGYYLGLTGARIGSDDCVSLGLAQVKVDPTAISDVINRLAEVEFLPNDASASVTQVLNEFKLSTAYSTLLDQQMYIDACLSKDTMEDILASLETSPDLFCGDISTMLSKKSPMSLKVTLKALQTGILMSFDECMRQEFRLTSHFLEGHDFIEGIRALIIDKDNRPVWKPSSVQEIPEEAVNEYFSANHQELSFV